MLRPRLLPYLEQSARWPAAGPALLAAHDEDHVVVYQAYAPDIALHAIGHQRFGGRWSTERMSWIKPGFLWMMYRSGWAGKAGQEHVLSLTLRREGFEQILAAAVPTRFTPDRYADEAAWKAAGETATVRLQWDPDHDPRGEKLPRKAIQLGLRGETLRRFNQEWLVAVDDVTAHARAMAPLAASGEWAGLLTPEETPLEPRDPAVRARLSAC